MSWLSSHLGGLDDWGRSDIASSDPLGAEFRMRAVPTPKSADDLLDAAHEAAEATMSWVGDIEELWRVVEGRAAPGVVPAVISDRVAELLNFRIWRTARDLRDQVETFWQTRDENERMTAECSVYGEMLDALRWAHTRLMGRLPDTNTMTTAEIEKYERDYAEKIIGAITKATGEEPR